MTNNNNNLMNAVEIISAENGIIDVASAKALRDINAKINTKTARLGEIITELAVMVKHNFFTALADYIDGKAWMTYEDSELNKFEFEKKISEYNTLIFEKNNLLKEIEELKSATDAFKIPAMYLDLMEEV